VIRIIIENDLHALDLGALCYDAPDLQNFIFERLRVKLKSEGQRFDILDAVFAVSADGNLIRLMQRVNAVRDLLSTPDGANLLVAYRRGANILRIEDAKDGPHGVPAVNRPLHLPAELMLREALWKVGSEIANDYILSNFSAAIQHLSKLRAPVDKFFADITVNDPVPENRLNRLGLLAQLRNTMHTVADFSKIEG